MSAPDDAAAALPSGAPARSAPPIDRGALRAAGAVVSRTLAQIGDHLVDAHAPIAAALRGDRSLGSRARRLAGDALWEAVRLDARARARLTAAGGDPADPALRAALALFWAAPGFEPADAAAACGADAALIGAALAAPAPDPATASPQSLAAEWSVLPWLAEQWLATLGPEGAAARAAAMNGRAPLTVRANRLRTDRDALAAALAAEGIGTTPGRHAPDALVLAGHPNVRALNAWKRGLFEVQDEASQLAARLLVPSEVQARGAVVVDLCAGAGGKTLALAALAPHASRLIAVERDRERLVELRHRAERAGLHGLEWMNADAADPAVGDLGRGQATHVFLDAPCSGLGTLRRDPALRWRATRAWADTFPALQTALLRTALALLGPGGRLVYATCTERAAENDDVLAAALASRPGARRAPPPPSLAALASDGALRLSPETHGTDGFFAALVTA